MKLAQYLADNFGQELQIPTKKVRTKWNTEELNSILLHNLASDMIKNVWMYSMGTRQAHWKTKGMMQSISNGRTQV